MEQDTTSSSWRGRQAHSPATVATRAASPVAAVHDLSRVTRVLRECCRWQLSTAASLHDSPRPRGDVDSVVCTAKGHEAASTCRLGLARGQGIVSAAQGLLVCAPVGVRRQCVVSVVWVLHRLLAKGMTLQ